MLIFVSLIVKYSYATILHTIIMRVSITIKKYGKEIFTYKPIKKVVYQLKEND